MKNHPLLLVWLITLGSICVDLSIAADKPTKPSKAAKPATQPKVVEPEDELTVDDLLRTLDELKDPTKPRSVELTNYLQRNYTIHKELLEQFHKHYPKLLKDAVSSSGNPHNPKIVPLRAVFAECLLKTPTVLKVEEKLKGMGLMLDGVTFEKFWYMEFGGTGGRRFFSMASLNVKPIAK